MGLLCTARSQWPRGLRRGSAAARLLRLWVRTQPEAWMSVWWECCVLSGSGLCDELITRPEESYRLWCVVLCVCVCVRAWSRHLVNEEALAHWEAVAPKTNCVLLISPIFSVHKKKTHMNSRLGEIPKVKGNLYLLKSCDIFPLIISPQKWKRYDPSETSANSSQSKWCHSPAHCSL